MRIKTPLLVTAILLFFHLPALACPQTAQEYTDYQRRDNNRCEGIINRADASSSFKLISFASINTTNLTSTLNLKVPFLPNSRTEVVVQHRQSRYRLDDFTLRRDGSWSIFTWPANLLREEKIQFPSLQALAFFGGTQPIYLPVILGRSSGKYEFVFFTPNPATIPMFEILFNDKRIHSNPRLNPASGEIKFVWDGRNAPKGRYKLSLRAEIQQRGQPPEKIPRIFLLEHDPNWLK